MLRRRIECGVDKAAALDVLLLKNAAKRQGPFGEKLSVYVGDSMSDLAPLLSVDLGIVIGQNKLLRRVARAAGITLKPLVAGELTSPQQQSCKVIMVRIQQTNKIPDRRYVCNGYRLCLCSTA